MQCLDKAIECGYKILPIILDRASTNAKVLRITNKALNPATNCNPTPNVQLQLETSFARKCQKYFTLFCVPHMAKTLRNALFAKGNYFSYPKLSLSCSYVLEAGTCSANWIRDLFHKNKGQIASSFRIS